MDKQPATWKPCSDTDLRSLFHRSCRNLRRDWAQQLQPWGLTPFQWRALSRLADGGGSMRAGRLADYLHIAARSATEVVDLLERQGLVRRVPDLSDRRARLVELTEKGSTTVGAVRDRRGVSSEQFFSVLSEDERSQLAKTLEKLASREEP